MLARRGPQAFNTSAVSMTLVANKPNASSSFTGLATKITGLSLSELYSWQLYGHSFLDLVAIASSASSESIIVVFFSHFSSQCTSILGFHFAWVCFVQCLPSVIFKFFSHRFRFHFGKLTIKMTCKVYSGGI